MHKITQAQTCDKVTQTSVPKPTSPVTPVPAPFVRVRLPIQTQKRHVLATVGRPPSFFLTLSDTSGRLYNCFSYCIFSQVIFFQVYSDDQTMDVYEPTSGQMLLSRVALPKHLRVSGAQGPNEAWTQQDERVVHDAVVEALLPPVVEAKCTSPSPSRRYSSAPFVRIRLPIQAHQRHLLATASNHNSKFQHFSTSRVVLCRHLCEFYYRISLNKHLALF